MLSHKVFGKGIIWFGVLNGKDSWGHETWWKSRTYTIFYAKYALHMKQKTCWYGLQQIWDFSTKSITFALDKLGPLPQQDAIKGLWCGLVPHRIEVFVWTALLGKIHTRSKLASLGIIPLESDVCPLCSSTHETSSHLLLHYLFSQQLWSWWLDLLHVKWVFPSSPREAFD